MRKFLKWILILIVPFGWLLYILMNENLRRKLLGKVSRFFHSIYSEQRRKFSDAICTNRLENKT